MCAILLKRIERIFYHWEYLKQRNYKEWKYKNFKQTCNSDLDIKSNFKLAY